MLSLDPVLTHTAAAAVAVIFILAALQKLRDPAAFRLAVENYRVLPAPIPTVVALVLPIAEIVAAIALLFADTRPTAAALATALLAVFAAAMAVNLVRGRTDLDCGCGGPGSGQKLSAGLLVRNALLVVLVLIAAGPVAPRALVALDYATVACATLALLLTYAAGNQLLANHPRLLSLRNRHG
jgi:uncharacterized membrane protein/multisubunit Na+/H+ antiporter MnhF subunit